jgi:hypothetical protein
MHQSSGWSAEKRKLSCSWADSKLGRLERDALRKQFGWPYGFGPTGTTTWVSRFRSIRTLLHNWLRKTYLPDRPESSGMIFVVKIAPLMQMAQEKRDKRPASPSMSVTIQKFVNLPRKTTYRRPGSLDVRSSISCVTCLVRSIGAVRVMAAQPSEFCRSRACRACW